MLKTPPWSWVYSTHSIRDLQRHSLIGLAVKEGDKDITEGSRYRIVVNEEPSGVYS